MSKTIANSTKNYNLILDAFKLGKFNGYIKNISPISFSFDFFLNIINTSLFPLLTSFSSEKKVKIAQLKIIYYSYLTKYIYDIIHWIYIISYKDEIINLFILLT